MMSDDELILAASRWEAIKCEAMTGDEGPTQIIHDAAAEWLSERAGLDPAQVAGLQEIVEPQLREVLVAALREAIDGPLLLTTDQLETLGSTAAAYYMEAVLFGHWLAGQAADRDDP